MRIIILLFTLALCGHLHADELRSILTPEDAKALATCEETLSKSLEPNLASDDPETLKAAKDLSALLALPRKKPADRLALEGKWKVRSLQVSRYGVFTYPFFNGEFRREGESGLIFHKNSGSQRRMGIVGEDGEDWLLFVGGKYYNDDAQGAAYSGFQEESVKTDPKMDSFGRLYEIGKDRLLLIFGETTFGPEVYELKKGK
ncbi:MAG: DUF4893 domain-containing protein [Verrucomicrobiae bacterium]|nr:DUF4893 domain-containing protein [Verrucomicrobiae bacterium]